MCYIHQGCDHMKSDHLRLVEQKHVLYPVIASVSVSTHPSVSNTLIWGRPKNPSYTLTRSTSPGQQPILSFSLSPIGRHLIRLLWTDPLQKNPHLRVHDFCIIIITPSCVLISKEKTGLTVKSAYEHYTNKSCLNSNLCTKIYSKFTEKKPM